MSHDYSNMEVIVNSISNHFQIQTNQIHPPIMGKQYPSDFWITLVSGREFVSSPIEVVSLKDAYSNELSLLDGDKSLLAKYINKNNIGAYSRLSNSRFFYREL